MRIRPTLVINTPQILNITGYVSKEGHGIKIITQKTDGATSKLRIFSNGKTSCVNVSKKDDWAGITRLYEESYDFFKGILKKFSNPGDLKETESKNILKSYWDYRSKSRSRNTWWRPSGKPIIELSKETKAFMKMMADAHERAIKSNARFRFGA